MRFQLASERISIICNNNRDVESAGESRVSKGQIFMESLRKDRCLLILCQNPFLFLNNNEQWNYLDIYECSHFYSLPLYIQFHNKPAGKVNFYTSSLNFMFETDGDAQNCK